jgi:uncharacterized protein (DUF488 family)
MNEVRLFAIGFTRKSAARFFELLRTAGVRRIVDVRLNNSSQLAGFAKRDDLRYFAHEICGIDYVHLSDLAPTKELLDAYRKEGGDWDAYERQFLELVREREIETTVPRELVDGGCLLCSEHEPDQCHRRLVAEYLQACWGGDVRVEHLF